MISAGRCHRRDISRPVLSIGYRRRKIKQLVAGNVEFRYETVRPAVKSRATKNLVLAGRYLGVDITDEREIGGDHENFAALHIFSTLDIGGIDHPLQ